LQKQKHIKTLVEIDRMNTRTNVPRYIQTTIELRPETIQKLKFHHNRYYKDSDTYDNLVVKLLEFYEKSNKPYLRYMNMDIEP